MNYSRSLGVSVCRLLRAFGRSTSIALVTLGVLGILAWRSPDTSKDLDFASLIIAFGSFCLLLRRNEEARKSHEKGGPEAA